MKRGSFPNLLPLHSMTCCPHAWEAVVPSSRHELQLAKLQALAPLLNQISYPLPCFQTGWTMHCPGSHLAVLCNPDIVQT